MIDVLCRLIFSGISLRGIGLPTSLYWSGRFDGRGAGDRKVERFPSDEEPPKLFTVGPASPETTQLPLDTINRFRRRLQFFRSK